MKSASKQKRIKRSTRHKRVRARVFGTSGMPRLCVFRSGKHIYAQVIDDENGRTLVSASSAKLNLAAGKAGPKAKKVDASKEVGKSVAEQALAKKINRVVFDRGGYKYHGRIKALAEGAREEGLKF